MTASMLARLGAFAGAFCFITIAVAAQIQPPASEIPIPPKPPGDSAPRVDTLHYPVGRTHMPVSADIGPAYSWDREAMFASGALSVADLLERVPGVTVLRSGWLTAPKFAGLAGDFSTVRVFYDGVELDGLDPRAAPLLDLTLVPLWSVEHVGVERAADEIRVHLRSWGVDRTTPYTRTDVSTGDEDSNLYRGFYGKRFSGGQVLQLAAQQFSTTAARVGGGGDELSFVARAGIGRDRWSVDAFMTRSHLNRLLQGSFGTGMSVPTYDGTYQTVYLRGAFGNASRGPWAQALLAAQRHAESSPFSDVSRAASLRVPVDTADTTITQQQIVLSGGYASGGVRLIGMNRIRSRAGETVHDPEVRLEVGSAVLGGSAFVERSGVFNRTRFGIVARANALNRFAVAGALTRVGEGDTTPAFTAARIEAGARLLGTWFSAGFLTRDTARLFPPVVFDTAYAPAGVASLRGVFLAARGKIYKDIGLDIVALSWDSAAFYKPRRQARSEINLITRWLSRFRSGNFGLHVALVHEYRDGAVFPLRQNGTDATGFRTVASSNVFSGVLEIRILRGVLSYQVRNMTGELYQVVPDFYMPRAINFYGIRWEFWN